MREVASAEVEDGVLFLVDRSTAVAIREDDVYGGVRVKIPAELDRARTILSLDVSIGDPVTPPPVTVTYPALLDESFELVAYPMVTLLAEKIETMIRRGAANTRERDFADVWMLIRRHQISGAEFRRALGSTTRHRGTALVPLLGAVGDLASVRQAAWATYRQRARIGALPEQLSLVLAEIGRFIDPVSRGEEVTLWRPEARSWDT